MMKRLGRDDETLIFHGKLSHTRSTEGRGGEVAASARVVVSCSKSGDERPEGVSWGTKGGCKVIPASN